MENCPACERRFEKIEDFPRIYVVDFQKLELPNSLVIPSYNKRIEIEADSTPREVREFFLRMKEIVTDILITEDLGGVKEDLKKKLLEKNAFFMLD